MVTKDQLLALYYGAELHYTGQHDCSQVIGKHGGITEHITRVRQSGKVLTWKRDPARFHMPVKYGLYENGYIDHRNCQDYHLASDCSLRKE
jgi:hypothetical protein